MEDRRIAERRRRDDSLFAHDPEGVYGFLRREADRRGDAATLDILDELKLIQAGRS